MELHDLYQLLVYGGGRVFDDVVAPFEGRTEVLHFIRELSFEQVAEIPELGESLVDAHEGLLHLLDDLRREQGTGGPFLPLLDFVSFEQQLGPSFVAREVYDELRQVRSGDVFGQPIENAELERRVHLHLALVYHRSL